MARQEDGRTGPTAAGAGARACPGRVGRVPARPLLLLGLVLLPSVTGLAGARFSRPNPHPFLWSEDCLQCHETRPEGRPGTDFPGTRLKKILPLCLACHPDEERLHPVGIRPDFAPPPDLRLEAGGIIGCVTCHRAHGERYSPYRHASESPLRRLIGRAPKRYKTYYLRRVNARGELCLACHY